VALRVLYERNLEYNNKVYVCYVDYEKAFDRVDWTKLMTILQNTRVDWRDRKLIWNLYNKQVAYVRIEDGDENNKLKIYVDGQQMEQVSQFRYLGSLISEHGYCTKEIRSRIEMAKNGEKQKNCLQAKKHKIGKY